MAADNVAGAGEPPKLEALREARRAPLDEARPDAGLLARPAREGMEGAADGLVMGTGMVDAQPVAVVAYDYTAHAGTQRFDVDDVIDPADTRRLLAQTLARLPVPPRRVARKHPVDPL